MVLKPYSHYKGSKMIKKKIGDVCMFKGVSYGLGGVTDVKIGLELLKNFGLEYSKFLSPSIKLEVKKLYKKYLKNIDIDR